MNYVARYHRAMLVFENVYCKELVRIMNQIDRLKRNEYVVRELTPYVDQETVACKIVIQRIDFILKSADYILVHDILLDEYKPEYKSLEYDSDYDFFNTVCMVTLQRIFKCAMLLYPIGSKTRDLIRAYSLRLNIVSNEVPRGYKDNQNYLRRYIKLRAR